MKIFYGVMTRLLIFYCVAIQLVKAQTPSSYFTFQYDQQPAISINGRSLLNPWAGGLNSVQYATMRLNSDSHDDLIVFDRTSRKVSTFVATTDANRTDVVWQYAPQYEAIFPLIDSWIFLVDYDGDGQKDLFTLGGLYGNIRVYHNETQNGQAGFRLVTDMLMTDGLSARQPLFVSAADLPSITDVDDDGDVDILTFDVTGNRIAFQQNMSVDRTGKPGLDFKRISCQTWGHFQKEFCNDFKFGIPCNENQSSDLLLVTSTPNPTSTGARPMHSGNTLSILDTDGDGKKDILFGFVSCDNIARLRNTGPNGIEANFTSFDSLFPAQNPIKFPAFASVYWEDVDGDGNKDLLASPFVSFNENQAYDFGASSWFYRNVGTNQKPDFKLIQKDFLQNDMLDLGENASPALADLDGDGDMDLLVGYSRFRFRSGLWYFENKGTPQKPDFTLVTTDYLGLSQRLGLTETVPLFVDWDKNGSIDLILIGTGSRGVEIRVMLNAAPKSTTARYDFLTAIRWPTPDLMVPGDKLALVDVNRDGELDLLVSKSSDGTIHYFRNVGTINSPQFRLENQTFGGFTIDNSYTARARSIVVSDLNGDGREELLLAANNGQIRVYQFPDRPDQVLTLLDSLPGLGLPGTQLMAAAADLNGDQLLDIILGTQGGGLRYLRNTTPKVIITDVIDELAKLLIFPNPTSHFLTIRTPYNGSIELISLTGQSALPSQSVKADIDMTLDVSYLPNGIYILRLVTNSGPVQAQKVIVHR